MQADRQSYRQRLLFAAALVVLILPAAIYVYIFGTSLSDSHQRWGEFGSAMSGIYASILALLMLVVLIGQSRSQNNMAIHQVEQFFIQDARSDIEFFTKALEKLLATEVANGRNLRSKVLTDFQHATLQELKAGGLTPQAQELNAKYPSLFGIWGSLYSVVAALKVNNRYPFAHNYTTAVQKINCVTSWETCHALDAYHYALTNGKFNLQYEFYLDLPNKKQ